MRKKTINSKHGLKKTEHNHRIKSKSKMGVFWLAPILLLCLSAIVFMVAAQPYIELARSALKVYLVDPNNITLSQNESNGGYPKFGEQFATIQIDSIGLLYPVYQGDTQDILLKGVCHYYGSKFPGDGNNIVLDAHRTTQFANLGQVKTGDNVVVTTGWGTYTYQMESSATVNVAQEMDYCQRTSTEQLTLITCYPFDFVGDAQQRYIVTCKLVSGAAHDWGF